MRRFPSRSAALTILLGAAFAGTNAALAQQSTQPDFEEIARPTDENGGVFVTQIGEGSEATIAQQNSDSFARVVQDGNDNRVDLAQKGPAPQIARIAQDGEGNRVDADQDGIGTADLGLAQEGGANTALVLQRENDAGAQSLAAILQRGTGNAVVLVQDGSDNRASLTQIGDGNAMTATQLDSGNRLEWNQSGDGLADLRITQTGGANLQITQSNTGAQFAPPPSPGG